MLRTLKQHVLCPNLLEKFEDGNGMKYDPSKHRRRSIRLKEYDYALPGAYFITLVAYKRSHLFGSITNETMNLNNFGNIAQTCWHEIPNHFSNVQLDEFIIMPNHIHGIIMIVEESTKSVKVTGKTSKSSEIQRKASRGNACVAQTLHPKPIPGSLGAIV